MPSSIIAAAISGVISGSFAASALAFSWSAFSTTLVLGGVSRALAKKADSASLAATGQLITVRSPVAPWRVIYGQTRVGGVLSYKEITTNSKNYHVVLTFAGHVCESIGSIYLNDELVTEDAFGNATGKYASHAYFVRSLGAEAGQPFPTLVADSAGRWTDAHRQTGRTKMMCILVANQSLYPSGFPNITAIVKGRKVYDQRADSTNGGVGSQRLADVSTWTHSSNTALCVADYLTNTSFGLGFDYATEIDSTALMAAAIICDEPVTRAKGTGAGYLTSGSYLVGDVALTLNTGTGTILAGDLVTIAGDFEADGVTLRQYPVAAALTGGVLVLARGIQTALSAAKAVTVVTPTTEARYTCNGTFLTSETPQSILEKMLASMAGYAVQIGGVWHIIAGAYTAPTVTLTEDDAAGPLDVQVLVSRRENFNAVKGLFLSPENNYVASDFPAVTSAAYETEDNGVRVFKDVQFDFVQSSATAQRLARIELRRARDSLSVTFPGKLKCFQIHPGQTVAITNTKFGWWSAKVFFVAGGNFTVDAEGALGYTLSLREVSSAVYDWLSTDEQAMAASSNTVLADPFYAPAPTALAVSATVYDQTGLVATFSWTSPDSPYNDSYAVSYWPWPSGTPIVDLPNTETTSCEIRGLEHNQTYVFSVRSVNHLGVKGAAATLSQLIVYPTLPGPASVTVWAASDGKGNATRVRVKAALSSVWAYVPDGIQLNVALFDAPNEVTIASGGTGTDLVIVGAHILASDFSGYLKVLAGSTAAQLIVRPATNPLPTGTNTAGMFWAQFGASQWRKATSSNETSLYFAVPFDISPTPGDNVNWAEISWFDDRGTDTPSDFSANNRLAMLDNGSNYEVIRWSALTESTGVFHMTAQRAQEGTSAISADGLPLRYFAAAGPGTQVFDLNNLVGDPTTSVTFEADVNIPIGPKQTVSISANAYRNSAGGRIRSHIVPAVFGGEL